MGCMGGEVEDSCYTGMIDMYIGIWCARIVGARIELAGAMHCCEGAAVSRHRCGCLVPPYHVDEAVSHLKSMYCIAR